MSISLSNDIRKIGTLHVSINHDNCDIVYKSQMKISQIIRNFIVNNKYHDRKFKVNWLVIESQLNVTYNMKVKNRVPYIIEITTSSETVWHVELYSKKSLKYDGYSHQYLDKILHRLKAYLIENDDYHFKEEEIQEEPFALIKKITYLIPDIRDKNSKFFIYLMWLFIMFRLFYKLKKGFYPN
jgi:hypothetical protein